jgi:hypothetical protein
LLPEILFFFFILSKNMSCAQQQDALLWKCVSLQEKANREAEEKKQAGKSNKALQEETKPARLDDFPEIKDGEK